jgi:hypothetical protein
VDSIVGECRATSIRIKVTKCVGEDIKDQIYNEHYATNIKNGCNS